MSVSNADLLVEARAALHSIMTGTQAVEVRDSTGESIRYSNGNVSRLRAYIKELEALCADEASGDNSNTRFPMRMQF